MRYLTVTGLDGKARAAEVIRLRRTDDSKAVQATFRLPNGDTYRALVRPDTIKKEATAR